MVNIFTKKEKWLKYSKGVFIGLFLVAFLFGVTYVYFMNLAILKVADMSKYEKELSSAKRKYQNLEVIYMDKLGELDISQATAMGFVESEPNSYIVKQKAVVHAGDYGNKFR
jgi:hypothetical protein